MILEYREVGMLMTNCFLLGDEEAGEGVAIDPGDNGAALAEFFTKRGLSLKYILFTHGHFDHVMGAGDLKGALGGRILVHRDDEPILKDTSFGGLFGISGVKKPDPDDFFEEHDIIECGSMKFKVLRTPGHTPGSVSFLISQGSTAEFPAASVARTSITWSPSSRSTTKVVPIMDCQVPLSMRHSAVGARSTASTTVTSNVCSDLVTLSLRGAR